MRKTTKLLSLVLAALMLVGMCTVSAGAAFTDVSVENEALYEAVELLSTLGVAKGTTETTFGPDELVTRQQMAAFVYRLMKAGRSSEGGVNTTPFTDLEDSTYFNMVSWASNAGIIKGTSATTFNPKGGITLQDGYVMLVRALGYENDGPLSYPHGYVDKAEEIGLDEDIPSTVDYTATLTRGQVAILLANAFYADMNETVIDYEWIPNPGEGSDAYAPVERTETIAHKIFGVEEETFEVVSTAHYTLDGTVTYDELNDVDTIVGYRFDEDGKAIGSGLYSFEMDDLGLDGSSDDYFLAELTLFVKKDAKGDLTKDEVIAAKSNLVKKTVTAEDVVLETSTKTDKEYYVGGVKDADADKVMTGVVSFGGLKAYLDYDQAPYSYKKEYKADDAIKFIDLKGGDYDEDGNSTFAYNDLEVSYKGEYAKAGTKGSYDNLTTVFATDYPTIYNEGLYEADVYDSNGDGYADYLFLKNYRFIQLIDKKNKGFEVKTETDYYYTYTEEATIEGEYESEDFVLAYVNEDAKYVKVAEVVAPIEAMVTRKSADSETFAEATTQVVTFKSGEKAEFIGADEKYAYYIDGEVPAYKDFEPGKSYQVYLKGDVILYTDAVASGNYDVDANYAIVLPYDEENATRYIYNDNDKKFDKVEKTEEKADDRIVYSATGVVDGEFVTYYYVNVVIDGAVKAVKLGDYANTFVSYEKDLEVPYVKNEKIDSQKIVDKEIAETVLYEDFLNKFSTYTIDSDGAYTFTALDVKALEAVDFSSTDEEDAGYIEIGKTSISNFTGSIYNISGVEEFSKFTMKDYSKLIIKTVDDDGEDVYTVYTTENLPDFAETDFENVMAIFVNNTKSKYENLGILYAEIEEFESEVTYDYRLVVGLNTIVDEDNKATKVVKLLNVKDNTKVSDIEFAKDSAFDATERFVYMNEAGEAVNEGLTIDGTYRDGQMFKATFDKNASYDVANKFLEVGTKDKDGKACTFLVSDDTTILFYTSTSTSAMAEEDILTIEDNEYEGLEDAESFNLYIVAEDIDDKNADDSIKAAKTIIVTKKNLG